MPLRLTVTLIPRKTSASKDAHFTKLRHGKTFSTVFGLRRRSHHTESDNSRDATQTPTLRRSLRTPNTEPHQPLFYHSDTSSNPDTEHGVEQNADFEDPFRLAEPSYPYLHEPGSHVGDGRMLSTIFESAHETSRLSLDDPPPYYEHEDKRRESATYLPTVGKGTKNKL